jgi:hypothetical protein
MGALLDSDDTSKMLLRRLKRYGQALVSNFRIKDLRRESQPMDL